MSIRTVTLVYGIVFLLVGIAGFVPGFREPYDMSGHDLVVNQGEGYLFGLFAVNILHNLTHFLFGVAGLAVYKSLPASRSYLKAVAIIYGAFVVMGLVPGLNTVFGLVPLHGHDVWLHLVLAGVAAYFGFAHKEHDAART